MGVSGTAEFLGSSNGVIDTAVSGGNTVTFNNFILNKSVNSVYVTIASGDVLSINGNLTLKNTGYFNPGSSSSGLDVKGNVEAESTFTTSNNRSALQLKVSGSSHQNVVNMLTGLICLVLYFLELPQQLTAPPQHLLMLTVGK
jgi:hypothetical protein